MQNDVKYHFKIGCSNIQGLNELALAEKELNNFVYNSDCVVLLETWKITNASFTGNYTYCQPAIKSKHAKHKGGIIIIVNNFLRKEVTILQKTNSKDPSDICKSNIWEDLEQTISEYRKILKVAT